jgi:hypothetical protein
MQDIVSILYLTTAPPCDRNRMFPVFSFFLNGKKNAQQRFQETGSRHQIAGWRRQLIATCMMGYFGNVPGTQTRTNLSYG